MAVVVVVVVDVVVVVVVVVVAVVVVVVVVAVVVDDDVVVHDDDDDDDDDDDHDDDDDAALFPISVQQWWCFTRKKLVQIGATPCSSMEIAGLLKAFSRASPPPTKTKPPDFLRTCVRVVRILVRMQRP